MIRSTRHHAPLAIALLFVAAPLRGAPPEPEFQSYLAHIAAAEASLRLNEAAETRRWLDAAPKQFRNWEWHYLLATSDESMRAVETTESEPASIALSPDGGTLALGLSDGTISLREHQSGKPLGTLSGHSAAVYDLAFSPDGKQLVSTSHDKTARSWDVAKREPLATFKGHDVPVTSAVYLKEGRVATASYQAVSRDPLVLVGLIHIWNPATGEPIKKLVIEGEGLKPLSSLSLSQDGRYLAAGCWNGIAYLYDLESEAAPRQFVLPDDEVYNAINTVAISPDGKILVTGAKDNFARVFDVPTGKLITTLRGHTGFVSSAKFSPDGTRLATAGHDNLIRIWDPKDWSETAALRGHTRAINDLTWTADGSTIFSVANDKTVRLWDAGYPHYGGTKIRYKKDGTYTALFSPDGKTIATSTYSGVNIIWDAASGKELARWLGHESSSNTASYSPDGKRLLTCSYDKTAKIWDAQSRELIAALPHDAGIYHCAFSPNNVHIATAHADKTVWLWNAEKKEAVAKLAGHDQGIKSVAFSPDGALLASTSNLTKIWDTATQKLVCDITGYERQAESAAFSPDGKSIVIGAADGSVRLHDARTCALIRVLYAGDDEIYRVAFSPAGSRVAAGGRALYLLDVEHGGVVLRLHPHKDAIWHLSFSPDGKRLATCSWDGTISILDTIPVRDRSAVKP